MKPHYREHGFILVSLMILMAALLFGMMAYQKTSDAGLKMTFSELQSQTGFNAAEAGINIDAETVRKIFASYNFPSGNATFDECNKDLGTGDYRCHNLQFDNIKVTSHFSPNGPVRNTRISSGERFAGLMADEYPYKIVSTARGKDKSVLAILEAAVQVRFVPIFQFSAFFGKDLEYAPGPLMVMTGAVHTNGDLYLAPVNGLRFLSAVTSSGDMYAGLKHTDKCWANTGPVRAYDPLVERVLTKCQGHRRKVTDDELDKFNGNVTVRTEPLILPPTGDFKSESGKPHWDKADLRLVLNLNVTPPSVEVWNSDGSLNATKTNALTRSYQDSFAPQSGACVEHTGAATNGRTCRYETSSVGAGCIAPFTPVTQRAVDNTFKISAPDPALMQPVGSESGLPGHAVAGYSNTFMDRRETLDVTYANPSSRTELLEIDVKGLLNCIHASSGSGTPILDGGRSLDDSTEGGLVVYATIKGPRSHLDRSLYGVRLRNGYELQSSLPGAPKVKGLTFVTDHAVFVMGDYNNPPDFDDRVPAAVMADAINVLSAAWDTSTPGNFFNADLKSDNPKYESIARTTGSLHSEPSIVLGNGSPPAVANIFRRAITTTQNYAAISNFLSTGEKEGPAGQDLDKSNGTINLFFRPHERWADISNSTQALNYTGSIVVLHDSQHNAAYNPSNAQNFIYTAFERNWSFDMRLLQTDKLPPMTPRFTYIRQTSFQRDLER
jgi:hypothetical protein